MKRINFIVFLLTFLLLVIPFTGICVEATGYTSDYSSGIGQVIDLFEENGKNVLGITMYSIASNEDGIKADIIAQKDTNVFRMTITQASSNEKLSFFLSGSKYDKEGFYAVKRENSNSSEGQTVALGYVNPEIFELTSTNLSELTMEGSSAKATSGYEQETVQLLHYTLDILQNEFEQLDSGITLADIGFIVYNKDVNAEKGELTDEGKALIDDYIGFIRSNQYPCGERDYAKEDCVDKELIAKYQEKMDALKEAGITENDCPEMKYGKLVLQLGKYTKSTSFVRGFYSTQKYYDDGMEQFIKASDSISAKKDDLAYSSMTTSAAKYESARDLIDLFDQNEYKVAELRDCFQKFYSGGTNMATGFYTKSEFLFDIGSETQMKAMISYITLSAEVESIVKGIEEIESQISSFTL